MAEHIKRLSGEKMKVEKRLSETERQVDTLEEKLRKIETSLSKRGIKLE
jgi:CII-binding regulator of phage lambda lysogenization HflD